MTGGGSDSPAALCPVHSAQGFLHSGTCGVPYGAAKRGTNPAVNGATCTQTDVLACCRALVRCPRLPCDRPSSSRGASALATHGIWNAWRCAARRGTRDESHGDMERPPPGALGLCLAGAGSYLSKDESCSGASTDSSRSTALTRKTHVMPSYVCKTHGPCCMPPRPPPPPVKSIYSRFLCMPFTLLTPREGVADPPALGCGLPQVGPAPPDCLGVGDLSLLHTTFQSEKCAMGGNEMQDSLTDRLLRSNKGHPGQRLLVAASRRSAFVLANLLRAVWLQLIRAWG